MIYSCGIMHLLKDMTLILKAFLESPSSISPLSPSSSRSYLVQLSEVMGQLAHSPNSKELAMVFIILLNNKGEKIWQ
tara:strand:- start:4 stop:234 length:231 start_codon:yes stop_codon:yes gene_type:complete